jgi:hypothetical protein
LRIGSITNRFFLLLSNTSPVAEQDKAKELFAIVSQDYSRVVVFDASLAVNIKPYSVAVS